MRISDWSSDVCSSDLCSGRDDRSCRSSAELRIDRQARDIPAHEQRAAVYVRLFSVQSFTHFLARFEIGNAFGVHFHRFPGARIAAGPCVPEIGRASGRESVSEYVSISGVAESLKKK